MSKKNKKNDAPEEEIVEEAAVENVTEVEPEVPAEEPAAESAEENAAVAEEAGTTEPVAESPKADPNAKAGTVSRPVNFRTGPSFKNAVIAELKAGSKLVLDGAVEGDKGTWYKCEFDGRTGFVKASGLIVTE